MQIVCCQLNTVWENKGASFARVRALVEANPPPPGALFILPEMFATGFSMNAAVVQDGDPSETELFLAELAQQHGIYVVGGVVRAGANGKGRNEAVFINPEGVLQARYRKMQPFTLGGESAAYEAGREFVIYHWGGFKVAQFICYDLRFPELFRMAVRAGAQMLVCIASWPVMRDRHWMTLLQARAIENLAYVVGVNRCGNDPKFYYSGRSQVIDPHGEILADAGSEEGMIRAEVEVGKVEAWRRDFPALEDMNPAHVPLPRLAAPGGGA